MPSTNLEILRKHRNNWYKKNKHKQISRQLERRKDLVKWYQEHKRNFSCQDCRMSFRDRPECLDFHHLDPSEKEGNLLQIARYGKSSLLREIAKCIPLCSNCHRTRHYGGVSPIGRAAVSKTANV